MTETSGYGLPSDLATPALSLQQNTRQEVAGAGSVPLQAWSRRPHCGALGHTPGNRARNRTPHARMPGPVLLHQWLLGRGVSPFAPTSCACSAWWNRRRPAPLVWISHKKRPSAEISSTRPANRDSVCPMSRARPCRRRSAGASSSLAGEGNWNDQGPCADSRCTCDDLH